MLFTSGVKSLKVKIWHVQMMSCNLTILCENINAISVERQKRERQNCSYTLINSIIQFKNLNKKNT